MLLSTFLHAEIGYKRVSHLGPIFLQTRAGTSVNVHRTIKPVPNDGGQGKPLISKCHDRGRTGNLQLTRHGYHSMLWERRSQLANWGSAAGSGQGPWSSDEGPTPLYSRQSSFLSSGVILVHISIFFPYMDKLCPYSIYGHTNPYFFKNVDDFLLFLWNFVSQLKNYYFK